MAHQLPPLRQIQISDVLASSPPILRVKTEQDVEFWKTTRSYSDLGLFLQRLNEAVVGCYLPFTPRFPSQVSCFLFAASYIPVDPRTQRVAAVLAALNELNTWIDEIPPFQSPQRFGNLAFREWGKRLEDVRPRRLV
jgi:serine/threonine-protein phosphatase 2A activator